MTGSTKLRIATDYKEKQRRCSVKSLAEKYDVCECEVVFIIEEVVRKGYVTVEGLRSDPS